MTPAEWSAYTAWSEQIKRHNERRAALAASRSEQEPAVSSGVPSEVVAARSGRPRTAAPVRTPKRRLARR